MRENKFIEPFQECFTIKYPTENVHEYYIPFGKVLKITKILISQAPYLDYSLPELIDSHMYMYVDGQRIYDFIALIVNPVGMGTCDLVINVKKSYKFEFVPDENLGSIDLWFVFHIEGYIESE